MSLVHMYKENGSVLQSLGQSSTPFRHRRVISKKDYMSCLLEFDVVDGEVGGDGVTGLEAGSAGEVVRTGPGASKGEISETSNINTEIT